MAVAHKPEDCDRLFMEAFNTGDLEGLVSLYEADAAFVEEGGGVARGPDAIREIMRGFFAQKLHFTIEATVTQNGDIALLNSPWTLSGTDEKRSQQSLVQRMISSLWIARCPS